MRLAFVRESDIDLEGDAVTTALFSDVGFMTEAEFLAIGETPERIELFDGSLHVSPGPIPRHQVISRWLANTMDAGAEIVGLQALEGVNVRLRPSRIPIPDLVLASGDTDLDNLVVEAGDVRLVCEITSPSNASIDKVLKMNWYAEAGIQWHLLVEHDTGTVRLHELADRTYAEHAVAKRGEVLELAEPIVATIDLAELLPPR
jgi:Uma2 family endonuclease